MTDLSFKGNVGLVHLIARKCFGWTSALGVSVDYEDVFQDVSMAFVTAATSFDPTQGIKFSAYLTRAAMNEVRKTVGRMTGLKRLNESEKEALSKLEADNKQRAANGQEQKSNFMGLSLTSFEDIRTEEGIDPVEMIESESKTPEQILQERQEWMNRVANLSPLAKLMEDMLRNPPQELLRELDSQYANAKLAVEQGLAEKAVRPYVSLRAVSDFIGMVSDVSRAELATAESELLKAASSY